MRRHAFIFAAIFASLLLVQRAGQADEPAYAPWQGQTQNKDMQQLLQQLRALIDKAERDKAADPVFLGDLRKLADSYDSQWPVSLFFDDFRDGNFTANPAWTVIAGNWQVDLHAKYTGLQSRVAIAQAGGNQTGSSTQNAIVGILGTLLQQPGTQGQTPQEDQYAAISTALAISNAFAIRVEIASFLQGGRFDLGPYLGSNADAGYFLTYAPATTSALTLSSVTKYAGTKRLASMSSPLRLEDGAAHVFDWKRDRAGNMTVALDGKVVLSVTDMSIRKPFDGLLLANSGGMYRIRSIGINGSR